MAPPHNMASPHGGRRNLRLATRALLALTVVGTVGGSVLAFADTQPARAAASTPPAPGSGARSGSGAPSAGSGPAVPGSSTPDSPGSGSLRSGRGGGTVPPLSSGSGRPHATSSGS